ncbi:MULTISPECIES: hypothetical protein [Bacillales]|uniref:hypothetical protein n=1 Tax=Bacillales TaxID=1385 RepID=UPI00034D56CE|nr:MULTISPECIES: hypothetical protein [Bacillales]KMZ44696.1 hypothetical protein AC624_28335 [Bacillus sp. FJAT-27238]
MFSSRLYPLFVRAVSFQTCDRAFELLTFIELFKSFLGLVTVDFLCLLIILSYRIMIVKHFWFVLTTK